MRKIDFCDHFNIETGCRLENCECEKEEPKEIESSIVAKNIILKYYGETFKNHPKGGHLSNETVSESLRLMFMHGARWQEKRMYNEEDLEKAFKHGILFKEESVSTCDEAIDAEFSILVEQFKKK